MDCKNFLLCFLAMSAGFLSDVCARKAIIGGHVVGPSSTFAYQVSIMITGHANICGGGIISNDSVLTAARCVIAANGELHGEPIFVVAKTFENGIGLYNEVVKVNWPVDFQPELSDSTGDIAVLKLKDPFNMDEHRLRHLHLGREENIAHKITLIAGFGWNAVTHNNIATYSDHQLRYEEAVILTEHECLHDHPALVNTIARLCARVKQVTERTGVCNGDEGGPLVFNGKNAFGVLSRVANNCSERTSSAIYTRVSHYRKFIRKAILDQWMGNQRITMPNLYELS